MSDPPPLDRESFQTLLADAFAIQQCGVDSKSLYAFVEVQRSLAAGNLDLDREMHQIAECTRNAANASGVAIARLEADRLVYVAASGSAVAFIGRTLIANLSGSARNTTRTEILCVENAQTDMRVEAAVSRQFGARSLLMLPINHERVVAGVLHILFSEPHTFHDREMLTYRLMARLAAEVMFCNLTADQGKGTVKPATVQQTTLELPPQMGGSRVNTPDKHKPSVDYRVAASLKLRDRVPPPRKTTIAHRLNRAFQGDFRRSVVPVLVVLVLLLEVWTTVSHRAMSSRSGLAVENTNRTHSVSSVPSIPLQVNGNGDAQPENKRAKAKAVTFKRIVVGPNEIDYVAEDVTIRHLDLKAALPQQRTAQKERRIGEDVTVRYFVQNPGTISAKPASPGANSPERSTSTSK